MRTYTTAWPAQRRQSIPFTQVSYLEGIANYLGSITKIYYDPGIPPLDEIARRVKFTTGATGGEPGLKTEFFTNANLSGTPAAKRIDKHVNYEPARGADGADSDMSIRWKGYFTPDTPGPYLIFVQGPGENGGYRLSVDNNLVFDNWKSCQREGGINRTSGCRMWWKPSDEPGNGCATCASQSKHEAGDARRTCAALARERARNNPTQSGEARR